MTLDVLGNALCALDVAFRNGYGMERMPVETENLRAGVGPQGAIGSYEKRVNLGTASQPFGRPLQAKARSIVAV